MVCALKYARRNLFNVVHVQYYTDLSSTISKRGENSCSKHWTIKGPRNFVLKAYFDVTPDVRAATCNKVISTDPRRVWIAVIIL